jgi:hypothetical protein
MTVIAPTSCNRCPPNITTGSRESGANLSTRYSGIFAEDGSTGLLRLYQLVKIEAVPEAADTETKCRVCGGPLVGREGKFVLKYYLLREAMRRERRKWRRGPSSVG